MSERINMLIFISHKLIRAVSMIKLPVSFLSFLILFLSLIPAFGFVILDDNNGHELHWLDFKIPVRYVINMQYNINRAKFKSE